MREHYVGEIHMREGLDPMLESGSYSLSRRLRHKPKKRTHTTTPRGTGIPAPPRDQNLTTTATQQDIIDRQQAQFKTYLRYRAAKELTNAMERYGIKHSAEIAEFARAHPEVLRRTS